MLVLCLNLRSLSDSNPEKRPLIEEEGSGFDLTHLDLLGRLNVHAWFDFDFLDEADET